jgi:hypothetical protein
MNKIIFLAVLLIILLIIYIFIKKSRSVPPSPHAITDMSLGSIDFSQPWIYTSSIILLAYSEDSINLCIYTDPNGWNSGGAAIYITGAGILGMGISGQCAMNFEFNDNKLGKFSNLSNINQINKTLFKNSNKLLEEQQQPLPLNTLFDIIIEYDGTNFIASINGVIASNTGLICQNPINNSVIGIKPYTQQGNVNGLILGIPIIKNT